MINKGHNTMNLNIDSKSQLAKLLATENITIQHNNVATASFNLEDRVLTLPVFKNPKGYVYDMLIAHEVSHALNTPAEEWKNCLNGDNNLLDIKDYINVNGFEKAVTKYSIGESSIIGGGIGWLNQSQLSQEFNEKLNMINIGEYTTPLKRADKLIILKLC